MQDCIKCYRICRSYRFCSCYICLAVKCWSVSLAEIVTFNYYELCKITAACILVCQSLSGPLTHWGRFPVAWIKPKGCSGNTWKLYMHSNLELPSLRVWFLSCASMSAEVTWLTRSYSTLCHSSIIGRHHGLHNRIAHCHSSVIGRHHGLHDCIAHCITPPLLVDTMVRAII
jgi:hypothetical protein